MISMKRIECLLIVIGFGVICFSQSNLELKKINSMNCSRFHSCIERIGNEKILIVGGFGMSEAGIRAECTAEILDSITGKWRFTGQMKIPREGYHKLIKLDNGKLLLIGGITEKGWTKSCELFDPLTERWSIADSMILNHMRNFTVTKMNDGRILVTGGDTDSLVGNRYLKLKQCEIYDPVLDKWKLTGSLSIGRLNHSALLLKDGRILVAGGNSVENVREKSCEIYDSVTEEWSSFPEMNYDHSSFTLLLKEDGTIVAPAGGGKNVEIFEHGGTAWINKTGLLLPRYDYTAIPGSNGNVIFCGNSGDFEEYDLTNYSPTFIKYFSIDTIYAAVYAPIKGDGFIQAGGQKVRGDMWIYTVPLCYAYTSEIVPVELTMFTGFGDEGLVKLTWSTATETNNRGFEVERMTNNKSYEKIGYVPGAGSTSIPRNYTFTDKWGQCGINFYRLKQIDYDGTFEYSKEIQVNSLTTLKYEIAQNYPNPFNPATTIRYSIAKAGMVTLNVYNLLGRKVMQIVNEVKNAGVYQVQFDGTKLAGGLYIYQIKADGFTACRKMLLVR